MASATILNIEEVQQLLIYWSDFHHMYRQYRFCNALSVLNYSLHGHLSNNTANINVKNQHFNP